MITICDVYKSEDKPEVYIYVSRQEGLKRVPPELLENFGEPKLTLSFTLSPDRKLAKEDIEEVSRNLSQQGYHLQMPPVSLGQLGKQES
jgi:uncharacterized protein YcgL (UPF0745 family)